MKKQMISVLLLLVLVGAAIFFLFNQDKRSQPMQPEPLLPELSRLADKIDSIEIANSQGVMLNAVRDKGMWTTLLPASGQRYPLEQARLSDLVNGLLEAKLLEAKTSKQSNYDHLGLRALSQSDSLATQIKITAPGKSFDLLIGKLASSGQGSYARFSDQSQSWLLDRAISVPSSQTEWLKQPILSINAAQISQIVKLGAQGFTLVANDQADSEFSLVELSPQQHLKYPTVVDGFVDNLVALRFEQIVSDAEQVLSDIAPVSILNIILKDGAEYEMTLYQSKELFYVQFVDMLASGEHYWEGNTYQISSFAAAQLQKEAGDFIEKPVVSQEESQAAPVDEGESPQ